MTACLPLVVPINKFRNLSGNEFRSTKSKLKTHFSFTIHRDLSNRRKSLKVATMVNGSDSYSPSILELVDANSIKGIGRNGFVSIVGFGSLLSEKSALSTFPRLTNFRQGIIHDYRRVFAHHAPIFYERGIANPETREVSSLSVEPFEGEELVITVFEIELSEVDAFIEREQEFRFMVIEPSNLDGSSMNTTAVVCARYTDEEYRNVRLKGDSDEYFNRYGKWGIERIWDDGILPCRLYLRHCVLAAEKLGAVGYENFLDHTYLADRTTTIRKHLEANPGIMKESPPVLLAERYGG